MTDYNFLMESRLSPAQFQCVDELSRIAYGEGINLYLVGGAVRDMTFGQAVVRDLDFAAEGDIQKILRPFLKAAKSRQSAKGAAAWGPSPAVVVHSSIDERREAADLLFADGVRAEIARCHQEVAAPAGRRPVLKPAMIFEDLKGRDFAFNAMAISLHPNSRGLLLDPKNGAGDIERMEIRALHSRSFWDDPVRIYRLFRLGLRLGFKPDEKTQRWLNSALEERKWAGLTPDRQAEELKAVLREEYPDRVLRLYQERGILGGLDRNLGRLAYDRFRKVGAFARKHPDADVFLLNFDCLVFKMTSPQKQRLAKKILDDPQMVKLGLNLDREAKKVARLLSSAKCSTPSQTYNVLSQQQRSLLYFLLVYYPESKVQSRVKNFLVKVPQLRAHLPESELLVLGVKPGPKFDRILERIFLDQLDGKIKTHQHLSQELRLLAGVKEPAAPAPGREKTANAVPAGRTQKLAKIARAADERKGRKRRV